jgi:2-methylcitrate dehydratase
LLNKALKHNHVAKPLATLDDYWMEFMLTPSDYSHKALYDEQTRQLMEKISFEHGGREYDEKYPDGIPTSIVITLKSIFIFLLFLKII